MTEQKHLPGARIADDNRTVIYDDYQVYLDHQAFRRNVYNPEKPPKFHPDALPLMVEDLRLLYHFITPGDRILDVGCRSGWGCMRMQHDGYPNVLGVDLQESNIQFGLAMGASVQQEDAHNMSLDDAQFDAVFSRHAWEHIMDPHKATKECYRVLKPGGIIVIVAPYEPEGIDQSAFEHTHCYIYDTPERFLELFVDFTMIYLRRQPREFTYVGIKADTVPPHLAQAARRAARYSKRMDLLHFGNRVKNGLRRRLGF